MRIRERQLELAAADRKAEEEMLPEMEVFSGWNAAKSTVGYTRVFRITGYDGMDAGEYLAREIYWTNNAWTYKSSTEYHVHIYNENSGHHFNGRDCFAVNPADANGIIPVVPLWHAYLVGS